MRRQMGLGNHPLRASQNRSQGLACVLALLAGSAIVGCNGDDDADPNPASPQREPVLETVVTGDRVVPQDPDARYAALPAPAPIRVRVQADWSTNIVVAVDGEDLPLRAGENQASAWFEPEAKVLQSASRKLFWDIVISLPPEKRGNWLLPAQEPVHIQVRDETYLKDPPPLEDRPPLDIDLIHFAQPDRIALPSDFFNQANGDNTKPDGRAASQVIAKGVVLAGWLWEGTPDDPASPSRNDGGEAGHRDTESEDYHYEFRLDNDFIERNYGSPRLLEPLRSAVVKGARSRLVDVRPGREFALADVKPNAAMFIWPGTGSLFTVELNAWHIADRGDPPPGWAGVEPNEPDKPGNAWPFRPRRPLGVEEGEPDLASPDYVIISGTFWQDTAHLDGDLPIAKFRRCWDGLLPGHGGWLELHPVDSIRRVDPPTPRKHHEMVNVCDPAKRESQVTLQPQVNRGEAVEPGLVLRCLKAVDRRFTPHNSFQLFEHLTDDDPPKLSVGLITLIGTGAQVNYILWYEEPDPDRPPPDPEEPCGVL